jgi:single-strand DNA-binding protein
MYQNIIIVGNLGRDPEMRYTPSGQAVTSFPVATNRKFKAADGSTVKETLWFRISAWGKQAENCNQYLKKGAKVLVEGRLTGDSETGGPKLFKRTNGDIGASFEVSASTVQFLDSRSENGAHEEASGEMEADEIPF